MGTPPGEVAPVARASEGIVAVGAVDRRAGAVRVDWRGRRRWIGEVLVGTWTWTWTRTRTGTGTSSTPEPPAHFVRAHHPSPSSEPSLPEPAGRRMAGRGAVVPRRRRRWAVAGAAGRTHRHSAATSAAPTTKLEGLLATRGRSTTPAAVMVHSVRKRRRKRWRQGRGEVRVFKGRSKVGVRRGAVAVLAERRRRNGRMGMLLLLLRRVDRGRRRWSQIGRRQTGLLLQQRRPVVV